MGRFIGKYEIECEAGEGGNGKVFKARASGGFPVAVKTLHLHALEMARARLELERKAMADVSDDHVVKVLDWGEDPVLGAYIVQTWIEGQTVLARLAQGEMSLEEALKVVLGVALGLQCLSVAGLVHRDIKPANIMIRLDGSAVILDLGLTRSKLGNGLTQEGGIVGTLGYIAPEEIAGEATTDGGRDLYCLGLLIAEMLTGRPAFDRLSDQVRAQAVELGAQFPDPVRRLVRDLTARDPMNRPRNYGPVIVALERTLGIQPRDEDRIPTAVYIDHSREVEDEDPPGPVLDPDPDPDPDADDSEEPDPVPVPVPRPRHPWWALVGVVLSLLGGSAAAMTLAGAMLVGGILLWANAQ